MLNNEELQPHVSPTGEQITPRLAYGRREFAKKIGVGLTSVDAAIKSGALRTVRLGKRRLITHADGLAFLRALSA